jgi:microcystin-dependent protein
MAQPYVGEIRMFGGNFAPAGWMTCDGQLLAISDYSTLFNLIGTTYGGNGQTTFALPDLRGRVPLHFGSGGGTSYSLGASGGVEQETLTLPQIPAHTHAIFGDGGGATTGSPANGYFADSAPQTLYTVPNSAANPEPPIYRTFNAAMLQAQGGSQPHSNLQPYLAILFIISLYGVFPSQS